MKPTYGWKLSSGSLDLVFVIEQEGVQGVVTLAGICCREGFCVVELESVLGSSDSCRCVSLFNLLLQ